MVSYLLMDEGRNLKQLYIIEMNRLPSLDIVNTRRNEQKLVEAYRAVNFKPAGG